MARFRNVQSVQPNVDPQKQILPIEGHHSTVGLKGNVWSGPWPHNFVEQCPYIYKFVNLTVQETVVCAAVPEFKSTVTRLRNVNVTEGESVSFSCETRARPPAATLVWLRNTQPLNGLVCFYHRTYIYTSILRLSGLCPGLPGWAGTRTNLDFIETRVSQWSYANLHLVPDR